MYSHQSRVTTPYVFGEPCTISSLRLSHLWKGPMSFLLTSVQGRVGGECERSKLHAVDRLLLLQAQVADLVLWPGLPIQAPATDHAGRSHMAYYLRPWPEQNVVTAAAARPLLVLYHHPQGHGGACRALHNLCPKSGRILSAAITRTFLLPAGVRGSRDSFH